MIKSVRHSTISFLPASIQPRSIHSLRDKRSINSVMTDTKKRTASSGDISPPPAKKMGSSSSTTNAAVQSFFMPASQKPPPKGNITWSILHETLIAGHYTPENFDEAERRRIKRQKIAGFDLDSTLTKPHSTARHPKDAADWQWTSSNVPSRLRSLDTSNHQLVIFSNQAGITLSPPKDGKSKSKVKVDQKRLAEFKARIGAVMRQVDVPMSVYAATERDRFRKPRMGMWGEACEYYDLDDGEGVDGEGSFFVGDAAGRTGSDKDFACSDRDFACNVGVEFKTPEEFFLGQDVRPFSRAFDPGFYLEETNASPSFAKRGEKDLVVFVGCPGAGKSTYYWNELKPLGYERVNQDTLKSRAKCLKVAAGYLEEGKSVAVDNTNADTEVRKVWIELARKFGIPARCVLFKADPKLCEHNEAVRTLGGEIMNPESRAALPKIAIFGFAKRYQEPKLKEGFEDITVVDFSFRGTPEQRAVWSQYYLS